MLAEELSRLLNARFGQIIEVIHAHGGDVGLTEEEQAPRGALGRFRGFTSLQFPKDDQILFYRQGNGIYSLTLGGGSQA